MRPTRRLLAVLAAACVLAALASLRDWAESAYWVAAGGALLLAALDGARLWRRPLPAVVRHAPGSLPVGVARDVALVFEQAGGPRQRLTVYDHHPQHAETRHLPQTVTVDPDSQLRLRYRLTALKRGAASFGGVQVLQHSPWDLWTRSRITGAPQTVRVYPNFAEIARYALLARDNRAGQMGIRKRRQRGEGREFHQLREYRTGDSLRAIDWKASSRMQKLIAREYQDERDQAVVFLLDCGRRLRAQDGPTSHFDAALNAMLLLGYVALRQGDAVGLMTFGGPQRWLRPAKGQGALHALLNTAHDLEPGSTVPDYLGAVEQLLARQRKRALLVVLSNVRDEDGSDLGAALARLRLRHLVLLASLREKLLDDVRDTAVANFDAALQLAAAEEYLEERRRAQRALQMPGVLVMDSRPDQLPVALVNRYLDIKRGGLL